MKLLLAAAIGTPLILLVEWWGERFLRRLFGKEEPSDA